MKLTFFSYLLLPLLAAANVSGEGVRIIASDLIAPPLRDKLVAVAPDTVEWKWAGRLRADEEWAAGKVAARIIAQRGEPSPAALENGVWRVPVGYFVPHFVVPVATPLNELSIPQIRAIFGGREEQNLQVWRDLDIAGSLEGQGIIPVVQTNHRHLASEIIRYEVLSAPHFRGNIRDGESASEVWRILLAEAAALGLAGQAPSDRGLRVVPVRAAGETVAFLPTRENVYEGDYPLRLPLLLELREEKVATLRPILEVLFSDEGAALMEAGGIVALPVSVRLRQLALLEE